MTTNLHIERRDDDLDAQELELISQYICHEMSAADEQRFERKLADDQGFFDRVMPLLNVWYDTDAWPIERVVVPVEPVTEPFQRANRFRMLWMGGTGSILAAAGIVFAMVMRSGVATIESPPLFADRDDPRPAQVTAPQTTPVTVPHKAPVTPTRVIAQSDNTFRGAKRTLDSATTRMVAANTDSAAQRVLAELDRLSDPTAQFTPAIVVVVVPAQPVSPSVPFTVLVLADTLDVSTKQQINDLLHPHDGPTVVGEPSPGDQSWWRRLLGKLRGKRKPVPWRGIYP